MPYPKGRTRAQEKADERRAYKAARVAFRRQILERDGYRCRCCGRPVLAVSDDWRKVGHAHELKPRSLGGDPLDSRNVLTLAAVCHPAFTTHEREFVCYEPAKGADGKCLAFDCVSSV